MYPCYNQGEWVSSLINFHQKLDFEVDNGAQDEHPTKIKQKYTHGKCKQKLNETSEFDSGNEITEFPRFIAIESFEEIPLLKKWSPAV